jgi:hypothetical protein
MNLLCVFLLSLPVWAFVLAVVALVGLRYAPVFMRNKARLAVKLFRRTGWGWTLHFATVSGGTVGPNETIASTSRLSALESTAFQGGNSTYPAYTQGALALSPVAALTAAGAITLAPGVYNSTQTGAVSGCVDISGSTVLAMTLALPAAGPTSNGGQDGTLMVIFADTTSKQHTITTPANGIQGSLHVITMAAAAFSAITLMAYNGSWWVVANVGPCVIS